MTESPDRNDNRVRRVIAKECRRDKQAERARDIIRRVQSALEDYRARVADSAAHEGSDSDGIVRSLPRREKVHIEEGANFVPRLRPEQFRVSVWVTFSRFFVWTALLIRFRVGGLIDHIRRVDNLDRRAARLVALIQKAGGSLIKVGQQLAMRVDILPYEYCRELAKLTDAVTPFSAAVAVVIIERATGKPIDQSFATFDPEPIGSASIACVFQAVLHNGHKVAVKVRRPGIGLSFAADIRAVRWTLRFLEATSLLRSGIFGDFVKEFEDAVLEELDFTMEAYHQTIFRREARKAPWKSDFLSAPVVYYEFSSREVLVTEFVSGMWMWELLAAVEQNNPAALARMHALNIDPKKVARRLHFVSMWGMIVSDLYHADPHPANIVVQEGGRLVFVDFGACGSMDRGKKDLSRDIMYHQLNRDMSSMVKVMLEAMEPLPWIDLHRFEKEVELEIGKNMRKVWSKKAPWYDKTSAANWLALFSMLQKYNIPSSLDSVRAFRAQMLYDTLAVRLYPSLDTMRSVRRFFKLCDRKAERRAYKAMWRRLEQGFVTGSELQSLAEIRGLLERGAQSVRRVVDAPKYRLVSQIKKSVFAALETMRFVVFLGIGTGVACLGVTLTRSVRSLPIDFHDIVFQVVSHPAYWCFAGLLALTWVRRILFRLRDLDTERGFG
jgi:ubiquinone biosynthesis protein